jgi:hypothetical protein
VPELTDYQLMQIQRNAGSGVIEFYINGRAARVRTPNLPNLFQSLNLALQLGGQVGVLLDYGSVCLTGLTRHLLP